MKLLQRIKEPGVYPEIRLSSNGSDLYQDGLGVDLNTDGTVFIGKLVVEDVRAPLTFLQGGQVIVDEMIIDGTWGDTINTRTSNVLVNKLIGRNIKPRLPYDKYHVDAIIHAYSMKDNRLDPEGVIENIIIPYIDIECEGKDVNGAMLSELNAYRYWYLGTQKFRFITDGVTWLNSNNLSNSVFGGTDVEIVGRQKPPTILIKDRAKQGVQSNYVTNNVTFINVPQDRQDLIEGTYAFHNTPDQAFPVQSNFA